MTAIQVSVFYKVYYFTCNWRHCNLLKTIPVIFRIVYGQMQQVPGHCYPFPELTWFIFVYVDISTTTQMIENSDFLMSCARFFPSAPPDSLSTLIRSVLCPRRLILMDFIKELPVVLVSGNTRNTVVNEV